MTTSKERAEGCLLGQIVGDSLGSLVEFQSADEIRRRYPDGVRDLEDGGTWNTLAGQPTDDSEMALALARVLVREQTYDQSSVREAYVRWLKSGPFDVGNTVASGLRGVPNFESQANGALMRVSPLGIFSAFGDRDLAARWAREDAWITHPDEVAQDASVVFVLTIAATIETETTPRGAYQLAASIAEEHRLSEPVRGAIRRAEHEPPESYLDHQGWVLIALQNAFFQLNNAGSFEEAVVDTVGRGGDTDTNAAITGAMLGAVYGRPAIPERWVNAVLACRPDAARPGVRQPRPEEYWPVDAPDLAGRLLSTVSRST